MHKLYCGDSLEVLRTLEENSVDSITTDPPYGIKFMSNRWDYEIPRVEFWKEALRVLKPGGHILVFCGTKTQHRMVVNIEDAGFEIRDIIVWGYSQGFPKSLNLEKQSHEPSLHGWGTALKPAVELITMARKPISESSIAKNMLKWGTGGINIDDSRIELDGEIIPINYLENWSGFGQISKPDYSAKENTVGRFPANLILDKEAGALLDKDNPNTPSRFFYCAKPSTKERNAGLEGMEKREKVGSYEFRVDGSLDGKLTEPKENFHQTVKPIKLMEYLVRLVTKKGGICLDPFMGSGSTGIACKRLGVNFIGVELSPDYFKLAEARIENSLGA